MAPALTNFSGDVFDFQKIAKKRLPRGIYEFIERGTEDDVAIRQNRTVFDQLSFRPRVLRDVSQRNVEIELLGNRLPSPILVAPTGVAGLAWYDGEVALVRAANAIGAPFCLSTASLTPMERIAEDARVPPWFQLYVWPDFSLTGELVERARNAGFQTLVVTVDAAVPASREYNRRNGFSVPFRVNRRNFWDLVSHPRWLLDVVGKYRLNRGSMSFENYPEQYRMAVTSRKANKLSLPPNDCLTWADFSKLRELWQGDLIIKGILHPDDARIAEDLGADAVIVSNHGGRNLDCAIPPLLALPEIYRALNGRLPIIMDGGIRRGSDVVKALAYGAKAVMVGRAPLWGLAAAGEHGAARALSQLVEETRRVMGSLGCASVEELTGDVLMPRDPEFSDNIAISTSSQKLNAV